jgi:hypothetical protein
MGSERPDAGFTLRNRRGNGRCADDVVSAEAHMNGTVTLSVGDVYHLGTGKDRIIYAGMPTEGVFSIAELKWEFFYRGYAWNLFFPREQQRIRIDGVNLDVESVGPMEITLRA